MRTMCVLISRLVRGLPLMLLGAWALFAYQVGIRGSFEHLNIMGWLLHENQCLSRHASNLSDELSVAKNQNRGFRTYLNELELERRALVMAVHDLSREAQGCSRPQFSPCQVSYPFGTYRSVAGLILGPFAGRRLIPLCLPAWPPLDFSQEPARVYERRLGPAWH